MIDVTLSLDGREDDRVSLEEWLRAEPELRGRIRPGNSAEPSGAMGGTTDLVIALASSGTLAVVARSVQVWLVQRKSDVTVDLVAPDGRRATVSAKRVKDPEDLAREVLGSFGPVPENPEGTTGER